MFHAIEVPLFCLPAFRYFTLHFNPKLSATLYMVGFQIASQIGQVVFSTPLGMLHDRMGDRTTFLTISAIVLAATVYGFFVIKRDDEQVDGDPFIRDSKKLPSPRIPRICKAPSAPLPPVNLSHIPASPLPPLICVNRDKWQPPTVPIYAIQPQSRIPNPYTSCNPEYKETDVD